MEWRCEWCGKPHAEDDPPCDNCGHGQFERAVVPAGPEGDGGPLVWVCSECGREHPRHNPPCSRCGSMDLQKERQEDVPAEPLGDADDGGRSVRDLWGSDDDSDGAADTMTVWACTECSRAHPRNNPPCNRCGGMTFEREERVYDADGEWEPPDDDRETDDGDDGAVADTMHTWVCTDCGRSHPRNNPPCNRCGGMSFERREEQFDDVGTVAVGWLDAVDPKVALGFVGTLLLLVLVAGPATGVFDLPGGGPPSVEDVPGESESVGGVSLSAVERSFVERLSTARREAGAGALTWNRELAALATYRNRWAVKSTYGSATGPPQEGLAKAYRSVDSCEVRAIAVEGFATGRTVAGTPADGFASADAMAAALVEIYLGEPSTEYVETGKGAAGAAVHVGPDGRVFVTVTYC